MPRYMFKTSWKQNYTQAAKEAKTPRLSDLACYRSSLTEKKNTQPGQVGFRWWGQLSYAAIKLETQSGCEI